MRMGWNPWRALRTREHLVFVFDECAAPMGGAVYGRSGDRGVIIIDPALDRTARRAALAHELVHDERGLAPAGAPDWLVGKEEAAVDTVVAQRMVPLEQLAEWAARRAAVEPVTLFDIAQEFDVPPEVAARAVDLMRRLT